MPDISTEINAFKTAVYGEDVRDAIVDLANKLNDDLEASDTTIDAEAISRLISNLGRTTDVDLNSEIVYSCMINTGNPPKWAVSRDYKSYIIPLPVGATKITLVPHTENGTGYALLTSTAHVQGTEPDFANGQTRERAEAGETAEIIVPDDAKFLWCMKQNDDTGTSYAPQSVTIDSITSGDDRFVPFDAPVELTVLQKGTARANIDAAAQTDLTAVENAIFDQLIVDFANETGYPYIINNSNTWSKEELPNGIRRCYLVTVPSGATRVTITATEERGTEYAFLQTASMAIHARPDYVDSLGNKVAIAAGETVTLQIPSDCRYIYILKQYLENQSTPSYMSLFPHIKWTDANVIPLGLHVMPENEGQLNVIKRCRQFTDIRWTPAVDLPRLMSLTRGYPVESTAEAEVFYGKFKAGKEYRGIPYGRADDMRDMGYDYSFVGSHIDFETFITSVSNAASRLCAETTPSTPRESVIYAAVCSALTCYALNVPYKATEQIPSISGLNLIGKINDEGTRISQTAFKLGDVLNLQSFHTAMVTDIIKDADGNVLYIELSEATTVGVADRNDDEGPFGGICRRKGWTLEEIYTVWGAYSLYRYAGIVNVPYTPSPYVNVGDELDMQPISKLPCMPYEGNKFVYKAGYIPNDGIKIVISQPPYDEDHPGDFYHYLRWFKDGQEIDDPISLSRDDAFVNIPYTEDGHYTAYLCNMSDDEVTVMTMRCEWTVEGNV